MTLGDYSNTNWVLDETVTEGFKVMAPFTICGTHEGEFFGIPSSGTQIKTIAMSQYQLEDGKDRRRNRTSGSFWNNCSNWS
jgi:predicted ester cyclase